MMAPTSDMCVAQSKAISYLESPMIRVVVGEAPVTKEFGIHEDLICPRSHFFKNAMAKPWKEAEEHKITLEFEKPDTFALYIQLLYTNVLPVKESTGNGLDKEFAALCKLYVLAEMLMDDTTKDIVYATILSRSKEPSQNQGLFYPNASAIQIIYEGTPEGSPARCLFVDIYTNNASSHFHLGKCADLPKDFYFDLAVSLLDNRPTPYAHAKLRFESVKLEEAATATKNEADETIRVLVFEKQDLEMNMTSLQREHTRTLDETRRILTLEKEKIERNLVILDAEFAIALADKSAAEAEVQIIEQRLMRASL